MTEVTVWAGWVGGIGIGVYAVFQLALLGKPLGVSTGYGNLCGAVTKQPFFHRGPYQSLNNWRLWFIIGLPLGGLLAALASPGAISISFAMGTLYDGVLPATLWGKGALVFLGGVMMGYGARLADGCTSGHAIAGLSLLNWPSLVAAAGFFVGGVAMVQLMFRVFA